MSVLAPIKDHGSLKFKPHGSWISNQIPFVYMLHFNMYALKFLCRGQLNC